MKEKIISVSIALVMVLSILGVAFVPTASSSIELPDYEAVDINSGLAGEVPLPSIEDWPDPPACGDPLGGDTPPVGTTVYDWFLDAMSGGEAYTMTLRAVVGKAEVWVQDDLSFPEDDPRNEFPINWTLSDEMIEYIAEEFNSHIYPTDTEYFGVPLDRYGDDTIFELLGWPEWTYDWIEVSDPADPQRVIIKILNYRDDNYYDWTYPYYVAGFFSGTYDSYYDRNMIHIDCWQWWRRVGPEGYVWYPEFPWKTVERPFLYESVVCHEYQHLIHADYNPDDPTFMNEACSMFAEILCYGSYGIAWDHINSYLYTPDNSLTEWGDQGDINILADYGAAQLWATYLNDHYGEEFIGRFVQAGIPGIDGINAALEYFGFTERFDDVFHDWRIANLIHTDFPGCGKYNYETIDLSSEEAIPARIYEVKGFTKWKKGTDFGTTETILGYDTGIAEIGPYGSDYIKLYDWKKLGLIFFDGDDIAIYGWTLTEDGWYSGAANLMNALLVSEAFAVPEGATLELTTYWDIEPLWDFGFVQVSTDEGETWTSLENEYTTYDHDPDAHPDIVANLPGLTNYSGFITPDGWVTMTFDLSAYAGENVLIGFRYMTDWATLYEGWYISEASVSGTPLELTAVYPEADFMVTVVYAYKICGKTIYWPSDMRLDDETEEGYKLAFAKKRSYVILVVSPVMQKGFVDYSFKATKLRFRRRGGRMVKSEGTLTMPRWKTESDGDFTWVEGY